MNTVDATPTVTVPPVPTQQLDDTFEPLPPHRQPPAPPARMAPTRPEGHAPSALRWFVMGGSVALLQASGVVTMPTGCAGEIGHAETPEEALQFLHSIFVERGCWSSDGLIEIEARWVRHVPAIFRNLPDLMRALRRTKAWPPTYIPFLLTREYAHCNGPELSWGPRSRDNTPTVTLQRQAHTTAQLRTRTQARRALKTAVQAVVLAIRTAPENATGADMHDIQTAAQDLRDALAHSEPCAHDVRGWLKLASHLSEMAEDKGLELYGRQFIERLECEHWVAFNDYQNHAHDGETFCEACAEDPTFVEVYDDYGQCTGDYYRRDDVYHWDRDGEYHVEEEPQDDDDRDHSGLLNSWGSSTAHLAHDTTFTPCSDGDFTMGVELEVEVNRGESRSDVLVDTDAHFNAERRYAAFKSDGSLTSDKGFEIVTAARRMGDHIEAFKAWQPEHMTSWDAGTCGLHVHIDSRAFTPLSLGKFLMFYNCAENTRLIKSVAGRHPSHDSGARAYAKALTDTRTPVRVKNGTNSRYFMVNVVNLTHDEQARLGIDVNRDCKGSYSTVEVRIFRGTLRKERLLAQIEFAHASVVFCRTASWSDLSEEAFKVWLAGTAGYPHLTHWLGTSRARNQKRLVVQEFEPASAEV